MTGMCDYCGVQLKEGESYICPACGRRFCSAHRKPQDHNCTGIKSTRGRAVHTTLSGSRSGSRRRASHGIPARGIAVLVAAILIIAAVAGVVLFGGDLLSGIFSSGNSTATSGDSPSSAIASGDSSSVAAATATTSSTGSSGSTSSSTSSSGSTASSTTSEVTVPSTGVYVYADYLGKFTGVYGTNDNQVSVSSSATQYYEVENATGTISAGFQKADSSTKGHTLTVRIYKNGDILKEGTTTETKGKVNITATV
ncbi:MAG: AN1-type zinc finger protein [Methanoregulaceae archaeon]